MPLGTVVKHTQLKDHLILYQHEVVQKNFSSYFNLALPFMVVEQHS